MLQFVDDYIFTLHYYLAHTSVSVKQEPIVVPALQCLQRLQCAYRIRWYLKTCSNNKYV